MTKEQFVKAIECSQEFTAVTGICKGVGIDLNSLTDIFNKVVREYFNYVDPEEKGLPVVMFFIHNGYYPIPDVASDKVFEIRDIEKLYEFWIVCITHGNPASKFITQSITDYKKDLE